MSIGKKKWSATDTRFLECLPWALKWLIYISFYFPLCTPWMAFCAEVCRIHSENLAGKVSLFASLYFGVRFSFN